MALMLTAPPLAAQQARHTLEAFVVAHADDWQLFMGDVLVAALRNRQPVLVIVTSAGDAARGTEFWQTREAAALASLRAAQALAGDSLVPTVCERWPVPAPAGMRTRLVRACRSGESVTVFLRLPDGRPDGSGYARHDFASLLRLAGVPPDPLPALDSTTTYTTLADLERTLVALLRRQQGLGRAIHVHTHDPDLLVNPIDHADHRVTGRAALGAARLARARATLYAGYTNVRLTDNLSPEAAAWKAYCFVQYDRAMMEHHGTWSAYAENAWAHALYLSRTHSRPADSEGGLLRRDWR